MADTPLLVSIVIATYKRGSMLASCLDSVTDQTIDRAQYELIIVEDGSHEAEDIAKKYNATYIWQENAGPGAARNKGIDVAKAPIVAFTDDDCRVSRDWLARLLDGFNRFPDIAAVGGYLEAPNDMLAKNKYAQYERYVSRTLYRALEQEEISGFENPAGGTNNLAYKLELLRKYNGFDATLNPAGEDGDLKWRMTQDGLKFLYLPLKVEHYRPYNFHSFLRQSYSRGRGSYLVQKKRGHAPTKGAIIKQLLLLPARFLKNVLLSREKTFIFLDFIFKFQEYRGMLKQAE